MPYPCIHRKGGLIPADILEEIAARAETFRAIQDLGRWWP
jgi:hypothetical protein